MTVTKYVALSELYLKLLFTCDLISLLYLICIMQ